MTILKCRMLGPTTKRVLVVEDDDAIRETLAPMLEDEGYQVSTASHGGEALDLLGVADLPDVILLDLRMPVMDGWTFRDAQRRDSRLASIPVVAISADGTAQATTISADAFLRKPLHLPALLATIARVLAECEQRARSSHWQNVERLASLGRIAAAVGHEINNPLAFVLLNVTLTTQWLQTISAPPASSRTPAEGKPVHDRFIKEARELGELLDDALIGLERIRRTVQALQSLTRTSDSKCEPVSLERVIDESVDIVRDQLEHRARLIKRYGGVPPVTGKANALGQVFVNLLMNAAQAIPEGNALGNEISVRTVFDGSRVVVEIADTGRGIAADLLPRIFDPFFTTRSVGEGTGLGLAICHQIVSEHGGELAITSELGHGTTCTLSLRPGADEGG
jgi:signal transduction histidine kinase